MMIRFLTLSCILLAVAAFAVISVNPSVKIISSVPQLVNPGDEFMVRITIDKGSLKKGAVLQQFLPDGLTASALENEGAQFYFENQRVRFVWENLPEKSPLTVAFKVKVSEQTQGMRKLSGTFTFVQSNNTAQINLPDNLLYISNDIPVSNVEHLSGNTSSLSMKRIITDKKGELSNGFRITLEVNNDGESGFAFWAEQIPSGYRVEVNQAHDGDFFLEGSLVKFKWKEMPLEKSWSFSYTLVPMSDMVPTDKPEVLGIMVFGANESIKTCVPTDDDGLNLETAANTRARAKESAKGNQAAAGASTMPVMPIIQRGIYYRIQIAATKRSPARDSQFFHSRFRIESPVDMIEQDGWRKYCIGTFERMGPAKTFVLETRSNIPDAFLVAYRDGQRIPVYEAMQSLSISQ